MGLLNETAKSYYEGKDGVQNSGDEKYGGYQFTSLENVISQFIIAYVGDDKIIPKIKRTDVAFHAQRALQELSFDTFKSCKSMELEVPNSLQLPLPQDYVNYVKLSWVDNSGIQRVLQPASKTSNPLALQQNADGSLKFENNSYQLNAIDPFSEYGIMSTSQSSASTGDGELLSKNPLPQFEKETRIALKNSSGYQNKYEVQYGAATGAGVHNMLINFFTAGHDIEVGMRIYGPGIPANSTVASVGNTTNSNYPGMGILFTNPEYKKWLLDGQPTPINPGAPVSGSLNSNYYKTEEVIFVNLNRKSDTSTKYQSSANKETTSSDSHDTNIYDLNRGQRYGLDPQHAQVNGSYYIDCMNGLVNFSSNISGKTVTIEYISDSLGTDSEMRVHKLAEEAMYKCIAYAIMSTRANIQEYIIQRFKRERFAETRKAKLRLSNFKIEELTQILRGKSKIIKH